jgi:hypothetical protein
MNPLSESIKTYNIQAVRLLLHTISLTITDADARIYLGLAKAIGAEDDYIEKVGIKRIETALILQLGVQGVYSLEELKRLVMQLIGELSEDCYSAQWLIGIEYELWSLAVGESNELTQKLWVRRGDLIGIRDLKKLSDQTQSWAIWHDGLDNPNPVEREQWLLLFQKHLSKGRSA